MKKNRYIAPSAQVVRLNIRGSLMNSNMGNHSGTHAGESYEGDDQAAKQNTFGKDDVWEDHTPKNLWDE